MQRTSLPTFGGLLLAALLGASGCQSMTTVSRGQSPDDLSIQPAGFHHCQSRDVSHFHSVQNTGPEGYCPSGNCPPQGQGYCPQGGYGGYCPPGAGGQFCGNNLNWYPRHHQSYSYSAPNDLKYPAPNAPTGMVTYPYYTLKGPSDFFRQ